MAEFVIVGGGVYGAGVAWWLTQHGAEVRLLEAKKIGNGASAGPGRRGTRANGRDSRELPLVKLAHELWPSLHERLGVPQFFERLGHLLLIERERDLQMAEAICRLQNQHGTETHLLTKSDVREREPNVCDGVIAALYCPLDGVSDHTAVTHAFTEAARKAGAVISEDTPVESITVERGRATAVITANGEQIDVGKSLFVLSNAGVQGLLADRISLPIWSRAFQVMLTAPLEEMPIRHLIGHISRTLAIKEEAGNRLMISGGYPGNWNPVTERGTAVQSSIDANMADAVAVYDCLDGAHIELADADHLESVAVDDIPVIDLVPGTDNALYAAAWSGHGWAIAPSITKMLAAWGQDGQWPELLAPFSHRRFSA